MAKIKTFLANTFAKWFKRLGFAGALRWRILYWTYKIWPGLHIRDAEWDWVLNYLPRLDKWQRVSILDVGCTSSLFIYELARRGYTVEGIDIRPYQERLPYGIYFKQIDICGLKQDISYDFDFVVCISVLEHILRDKQKQALDNMIRCLKPGGRLLLTIPTKEYAQGHGWEGFDGNSFDFAETIRMLEYTERKGQICVSIGRI